MKQFEKFLRSRNGMLSIFGSLIVILLVVAYFTGALGRITGTAGVPYPMPAGGVSCLPSCVENDGKMLVLAGSTQQKSMSISPTLRVWVMVPGDQPNLALSIFDGDTGKSANNTVVLYSNGYINFSGGNWDDANTLDTTYTLYADPLADGSGTVVLGTWAGNAVMPNNAWWETTLANDPQALAVNGQYYYRLEATRPIEGLGGQAFKVRANGYLMTGQRQEWPVGFAAMLPTEQDYRIIYPDFVNIATPGARRNYDGDWKLAFQVPAETPKIEIWDGGFDRAADTDDNNTAGKPAWASANAVVEGVSIDRNKNDDTVNVLYKFATPVYMEVVDPAGQVIFTNNNLSGAKDWEKTVLSTNSVDQPDFLSPAPFAAGTYTLHIVGLDMQNTVWLSANYAICDPNTGCPPAPNQ